MKILFAGIMARYPFGGVAWCSLMYLIGLRALGHDVFYVEDTGECVYDPVANARTTDPGYGTRFIHDALEPFGLGDRWIYRVLDDARAVSAAGAERSEDLNFVAILTSRPRMGVDPAPGGFRCSVRRSCFSCSLQPRSSGRRLWALPPARAASAQRRSIRGIDA